MKIIYKTRATATGGRSGHAQLDDGTLAFEMSMPGSANVGANPEQLFAIGYAACFDNALKLTAQQMKQPMLSSETSVEVGLGQTSHGGYALDIDIYIHIQGLNEADALQLAEATHQVCPYSNAICGNVDARLHVTTA